MRKRKIKFGFSNNRENLPDWIATLNKGGDRRNLGSGEIIKRDFKKQSKDKEA